MRYNATIIKREARMLEESKFIERIKNNVYQFVRNKIKRREKLGMIQKQDGLSQNVIKKRQRY